MNNINIIPDIFKKPDAVAAVRGSIKYPYLRATVKLFETWRGVIVWIYATGLPSSGKMCEKPVFAIHIHNGIKCSGNEADPFADAMTHYNPDACPHPYHAGDLPPLLSNGGNAYLAVATGRFTVKDVIGKTVVIHSGTDDFRTQPAGAAGEKIACGVIKRL